MLYSIKEFNLQQNSLEIQFTAEFFQNSFYRRILSKNQFTVEFFQENYCISFSYG